MRLHVPIGALVVLLVAGCDQSQSIPTSVAPGEQISMDERPTARRTRLDPKYERVAALVNEVNERFAAGGSDLRLAYPWLFRVGPGTDPFARLRTGSRWTKLDLSLMFDEPDFTPDLPMQVTENALENSFRSWNEQGLNIAANRVPSIAGNFDILDGTFNPVSGECLTVLDVTSPALTAINPNGSIQIENVADILVGGWLDKAYFEKCLGDSLIVGVTWSLSSGDSNGDQYDDLVYVEQFYNEGVAWTTTEAQFLDITIIDLESIAVHENGHAMGLGHFGGPVNRQPFKLKPNGRVFNPEAVMNPFYIGGVKRVPQATDIGGLTTLYRGH